MNVAKPTKILFGAIFLALIFFIMPMLGNSSESLGISNQIEDSDKEPVTLFFVGDIMLGRVVENFMDAYGSDYPFEKTKGLIESSDVSIGNFEGIVPEIHQKTKPLSLRFSVKEEYLGSLKEAGFDILSLANNHAYDFGKNSLNHTRSLCISYDLICEGTPLDPEISSFFVEKVEYYNIGYIFLHALYRDIDIESLGMKIEEIVNTSDFVVAYVHWGTEYDLYHNNYQEKLSHSLIDFGVDTVIGHHPHVVQDIEMYKGRPIFYSLGNYVFDQYFSKDVQEGLGLQIKLSDKEVTYKAIGFSSLSKKSQPDYMAEEDSIILYNRIFDGIRHDNGSFTIPLI